MHSLAHYFTPLFFLSEKLSSLTCPPKMASPSNPQKRTKRVMVKHLGSDSDNNEHDYLDRWFVRNQKSIEEYYKLYSRKIIVTPKVLSLEWLKEEKLDVVRDMLKFQKLDRFLKLIGNTFPDLVKVFLTNMWHDEESLYSQVKGIDIAINEEVWLSVIGLRNERAIVSRGNTSELGNFNKVRFYKSCLRNQESASKTFNVGGLATIPRILAYIVIWVLTPRGLNRATLIEEDLILMYCLMNKIKVNWVNMIREHLFKVGKKLEYRIPYVILLSQFIEYFDIDVETKVVEEIKALNQITTANLTKIGLKKMKNKKWICKADEESVDDEEEEEEKSSDDDDEDDEDEDQAEPEPEAPAAPSQDSFSRLEQLMMTQFNQL